MNAHAVQNGLYFWNVGARANWGDEDEDHQGVQDVEHSELHEGGQDVEHSKFHEGGLSLGKHAAEDHPL